MDRKTITTATISQYLLGHGWNEYETKDELSLSKYKKDRHRIYLCHRDDLASYSDLLERAIFTLSKFEGISHHKMVRKIFEFQPIISISINKNSNHHFIKMDGSSQLRNFAKSLLTHVVEDTKRKNQLRPKDATEFLSMIREEQTEAASYKVFFVLPSDTTDCKIKSSEIIKKINTNLFDLTSIIESMAVPSHEDLNSNYKNLDKKTVRLLNSLKEVSIVDKTVHFRMGSNNKFESSQIEYSQNTLKTFKDLKDRLEKESPLLNKEVEIDLTAIEKSKIKGYKIFVKGEGIRGRKKREVRVYLRSDQTKKIPSNIWDDLGNGISNKFKFIGTMDSKSNFDNLFDVSVIEKVDSTD